MAAGNEAQGWTPQKSGYLPSWHRTGLSMRPPSIRVLSKDSDQPREGGTSSEALESSSHSYADMPQKVQQLQRNINFLKKQHLETLQQLHNELERLKKENKDLSFRLVMCKCGQTEVKTGEVKAIEARLRADRQKKMMQSMSGDEYDPGSPNDELRAIFLEEEMRELKNALASEKGKVERLLRAIEKKVSETGRSSLEVPDRPADAGRSAGKLLTTEKGRGARRETTLQEYEGTIKRLQGKLDQKAHELTQIKADLRDVLYSHKWTPDAYLMARAYVSNESEAETKRNELPEIADSTAPVSKKMVEKAYQRVNESFALPALLPKVPVAVADKKRKTHAMQKHSPYDRIINSGDKLGLY